MLTPSSTGKDLIKMSGGDVDDFTLIKGIGPARQQWLFETLNVHTYRELAALSVEELESRLKDVGQIPSRSDIARWIAQAQELAAVAEPAPGPEVESVNVEAGEKVRLTGKQAKWEPFATFVVEFRSLKVEHQEEEYRTTASHMETDTDAMWPGLEGVKLSQWMLEQIREQVPSKEQERPVLMSPTTPPARSSLIVEIAQVRVFQPPDAKRPTGIGMAGQPFPGLIKSDQPFALEASFTLDKPVGADIPIQAVTYRAQYYVRNLNTGITINLGNSEPMAIEKDKLDYTAVLTKSTLPKGLYRLQVSVKFQVVPTVPGFLEVPLIQVV